MRNFKLTIEYDGTNYFGWQIQKASQKISTVQGSIEKAIEHVFGHKIPLIASGRTDTGVHALGQIANFKIETRLTLQQIQKALGVYLPKDILIKKVTEVPLEFHARYGAKQKWYRYTILTSGLPSVFHRHYAFYYPYHLNLIQMKKTARLLKGKHDFSKVVRGRKNNSIREIYKLNIKKDGKFVYVDVIGSGFLYKMVRRLVGMLIDAGRDKISLKDIRGILSGNKSNISIQTVPANGLCLMRVNY